MLPEKLFSHFTIYHSLFTIRRLLRPLRRPLLRLRKPLNIADLIHQFRLAEVISTDAGDGFQPVGIPVQQPGAGADFGGDLRPDQPLLEDGILMLPAELAELLIVPGRGRIEELLAQNIRRKRRIVDLGNAQLDEDGIVGDGPCGRTALLGAFFKEAE
jgi:hypothetical protein